MSFPSPPAMIPAHILEDNEAHEAQFADLDALLRQAIMTHLQQLASLSAGPFPAKGTPEERLLSLALDFGVTMVRYRYEPADAVAEPASRYQYSATCRRLQAELLAAGWRMQLLVHKPYNSQPTHEVEITLHALRASAAESRPVAA